MLEVITESNIRPFKKETYQFSQERITIGKKIDSDIYLNDRTVSKTHAEITHTRKGWILKDLKSTNGVYVDNKKVTIVPLMSESLVRIGSFKIRTTVARHQPKQQNISEKIKDSLIHSNAIFMDQGKLKERLKHKIDGLITDEKITFSTQKEKKSYISNELQNILGLGFLEKYLQDPQISEIMINGSKDLFIEKNGQIQKTSEALPAHAGLRVLIDRILSPLGRHVDEASPIVDARLSDGSRLNVVLSPISLQGPILTIRKFKQNFSHLDDLVETGTLTLKQSHLLKEIITEKKNILISGGTSSGKTTLLNVLSNCIDPHERIITIEDSAELQLNQPHTISLEARPANIEGQGEISIQKLVKNALRMRPDRLIVGECRGAEAFDMLQAMNTGHDGSLSTCHSNGPREALKRIENMVMMAGYDLPLIAIREQIASAIDFIVHMKRFAKGARRITDIIKICGMDQNVILTQSYLNSTKGERHDN